MQTWARTENCYLFNRSAPFWLKLTSWEHSLVLCLLRWWPLATFLFVAGTAGPLSELSFGAELANCATTILAGILPVEVWQRHHGSGMVRQRTPWWTCQCGRWEWATRPTCSSCGAKPDAATAVWLL